MSGPSATEKPMSAKIATNSSVTWLMGWTRPISAGGSRTGRVTSTVSVLRRASSAALRSSSLRAARAAARRSLSPLMRGPCSLRSSGLIEPSVLSNAETDPLLPMAAMRMVSIAASSWAAAMSLMSAFSRTSRSVIACDSTAPAQRLGLERIDEGASLRLRRKPLILHAHPPARLGIGVVDEHEPRPMHKTFALPHHDLSVLIEEDANENLEERRQRRHPPRRRPEYLVHLRLLVRDRRDRSQPHHGVAVAVHFLDAKARQLVGNFRLDVAPEELVGEVLRRQPMTHHAPSELGRLELLLLRPQPGRLMLEPPRRVHEGGVRRIHQAECGVIGGAGKRQHDRCGRLGRIGKDRHPRRLRRLDRVGCAFCAPEIDPHQALSLDAGECVGADTGEIDFLAFAQGRNFDA